MKKKSRKSEQGQSMMEYIIISSLIGIACLTALKGFGDVIKKRIENVKSQIVKEVKI